MRGKNSKKGMTLIEILIVVSLMGMISISIYNSLSNGIKVWQRQRQLMVEQDVVIFFEKISQDIRNSYYYSLLLYEGESNRIAIPTIVKTSPDVLSSFDRDIPIEQLGKVEYFFDPSDDSLKKRQANYFQGTNQEYGAAVSLVKPINSLRFKYIYLTETGELMSDQLLEVLPHGIEVSVTFTDQKGKRTMSKLIDILIGG